MPEPVAQRAPAPAPAPAGPPRRPRSSGAAAVPATIGPPAVRLGPQPGGAAPSGLPGAVRRVIASPGPGEPLHPEVRARVGATLGVDVSAVRVHTDVEANVAADAIGAQAFTWGNHVFLAEGQSPTDVGLIAHEVAHVVQQQGRPAVQLFTTDGHQAHEREAETVSHAAVQGAPAEVREQTGEPTVQPLIAEWVEERAYDLLDRIWPDVVPIIRQGVFEWIKEKVGQALDTIFETLTAPVRAVTGVVQALSSHFTSLLDWMRDAAAKIARGDCSALTEAAQKIQSVIEGLAAPVIDRIKALAGRAKEFFTSIWDRFGAPAWDFLRSVGGAAWERIQEFGRWIWEKTAPIRDLAARAWRWFKNRLGIGEGPEGQNGLLQWVQSKASAAWEWIQTRIAPFKRQLLIVAGVLVLLSPAGPILAIGAAAAGVIMAVRWIRAHLRTPNGVVEQRGFLQGVLIPRLMGAVDSVTGALTRGAAWVSEKLSSLVGGLGEMAGSLAGSILRFAAGAVRWIADQFRALANWATEKVQGLAGLVRTGLERLRTFFQPVLEVLQRVAAVLGNLLNIGSLVLGRVWRAIPACIRDPFVNFIVNQILRRIPIFASLLQIPEIWGRIRTTAMRAIRQVFTDGDLAGAAMTVFRFLLDVLRVPVQLVTGIFRKASSVLDLILRAPAAFLRNVLLALKQGLSQFFGRIFTHLLAGIGNWLLGQLAQAGVAVPGDLTIGSVFRLVIDILGITLERVFEKLAERIGRPAVERLRRVVRFLSGAWEWVATLINEGPAGLIRQLRERISGLWDTVANAIIDWLTTNFITRVTARLLSMLDPSGIMAVVNSVISFYRAVESAIEYLRQILEIVDRWLDTLTDIARGAVGGAATMLEGLFARAIPVAIGFLANQVGLSGLGRRIREMIERVRQRVDDAIGSLIDWALRVGRAALDALLGRSGAGAAPGSGEDLPFDVGSQHHHVFVTGTGETAEVNVASADAKKYDDQIDDFSGRINTELPLADDRTTARSAVRRGHQKYRDWKRAAGAARTPLLVQLKDIARELYALMGHPDVVDSHVDFGPGRKAWARPLTRKAGNTTGNDATSRIERRAATKQAALNLVIDVWRRLHMVSARLHGPNVPENLVLGTQLANTAMYDDIEEPTITKLSESGGTAVLWYETTVTPHPAPDDYAADEIRVEQGVWNKTANAPRRPAQKTFRKSSDLPSKKVGAININNYGRVVLQEVGLSGATNAQNIARSIVEVRDAQPNQRFTSLTAFERAVRAYPTYLDANEDTVIDAVTAATRGRWPRLKFR